ncbi:glycoside hydrolase family 92 protein [Mucilaginibacter robiniae]|uniref:Glycoside hydrolase family 92 protein n=1 Tax=Mucilaginibacter robiniae TaxID=2728022 RepID=A0A7L5DV66_9SPHI|nr:GH92 family glycosyl hydrolase [Mucilaginibacter robiniae]QJD94990.1 glycoside hydrolase family 92 protein [Mucilaginibacter robiniae]
MKKINSFLLTSLLLFLGIRPLVSCAQSQKEPVDYVNPYIGNISHLLVPTYPTIHLPNSLLRVYPERENFTGNTIKGLPLMITSHRGSSAFSLSPYQGDAAGIKNVIAYGYDNEIIKPYYYQVDLDDYGINVKYAPSHQAGIYEINFSNSSTPPYLILNTKEGGLSIAGNAVSGYQQLDNHTKVYIYLETDIKPVSSGQVNAVDLDSKKLVEGKDAYLVLKYPANTSSIKVHYGVSFISTEQAKRNLGREIQNYDLAGVVSKGRAVWNNTLGKIIVQGTDENAKTVFYTSLYRTYERMICLSEDGKYFSAYDGKVHNDEGTPFYTDDWIWDTYRAVHPLRVIIEPKMESDMINSYLRMASQLPNHWMPTFPEVTGDSRRMNSNHGVAMIIDAYNKGLRSFNLAEAYQYCKAAITEKTLAPWSGKKAGALDQFYKDNGYFPALAPGEKETVPEIHSWEKRQPVAVTLGTVYDEWCLGNIAKDLGKTDDASYFLKRSLNYHKVFNPQTKFFHPKDAQGNFIEPFDYRYSSGIGAREAYDENNGYVYRWDVQHNIGDLVNLMGGRQSFVDGLEDMFSTPLGKGRPDFYYQFGDHTGNVGQFSMGNEPAMHIPYLYTYAGQPWRTQKRVRNLLKEWFRNDLMGIPGDEDGGGLTSFVVFSEIGFYPVTPGLPMYVIGSPMFKSATLKLGNGKTFTVLCSNYSPDNKYIQSAKLNGKTWDKSWFSHKELMNGGQLELLMGPHPNKLWASGIHSVPPSFSMPNDDN